VKSVHFVGLRYLIYNSCK